ncbi:MAG: hypothetical protein M3Y04_10215, partial [Actinomycetota bacterium]|nr:hypothetical protein [Actinomycetota bacterium]
ARQWSARISQELQNVVSIQTQDVMAPPAEQPTTPGHADDSSSTQPEPTTADAPPPDACSTSSGLGLADIGPTPAGSPPVGDLPLIPREHP